MEMYPMFEFKEWLVCETIRTEVYEPLVLEMVYDRAYTLVLEAMSGTSEDDPRRNEKIALKDATIMIWWKAIIDRAADIEKLKDLKQKISGSSSDFSIFSNDEDDSESMKEAEKLLEKLGYIDKEKLDHNANNSGTPPKRPIEDLLRQALEWASNETGNELPKGVDERRIREIIEKEKSKSKESFIRIIASHVEDERPEKRGLFQQDYDRHARLNQSKVRTPGSPSSATGHIAFEAPDLANSVALRLYDKFSKRQWGNSGFGKIGNADYGIRKTRPKEWSMPGATNADLSKMGRSDADLGDSSGSDAVYSYIRGSIRKEPSKQRRDMNLARNPSVKGSDPVPYRKRRISIINKDVSKDWENSSKKYVKLLSMLRGDVEQAQSAITPGKKPTEDQLRHDIVLDMLRHNSHPVFAGKAGDPGMLMANLKSYRDRFLKRSETPGMVISALTGKDDDKGWDAGDIRDRDEKLSQSDKENVPRSMYNPAAQAQSNENRAAILERLLELMKQLRQKSPQMALALCVKFNMNQSLSSTRDVEGILRTIVSSNMKSTSDCEDQMSEIGPKPQEVADKLGLKYASVREQIRDGIRFLCRNWLNSAESKMLNRHMDIAKSRGWVQSRASFAGAKPSPLSSMMKKRPEVTPQSSAPQSLTPPSPDATPGS